MRIEFNPESESLEGLRVILYVVERAIDERKSQMIPKGSPDAMTDKEFVEHRRAIAATADRKYAGAVIDPNTGQVLTASEARDFGVIDPDTGEVLTDAEVAARARQAFGGNPPPPAPIATATVAGISGTTAGAAHVPAPPLAPGASPAGAAGAVSTTASTAPAGADRDSKGIPWDTRIHSEARTKNNDGTWRYKRKLDDKTKGIVLAEIMSSGYGAVAAATNNVPTPPGVPPVPPPPPPPVSLPAVPVPPPPGAGVPNPPHAVVVPPPPVNPTSAAPAAASNGATAPSTATEAVSPTSITFRELIVKMNKGLAAGSITQDAIQLACSELGIESPAALGMPDYAHLIGYLDAKLFPNG